VILHVTGRVYFVGRRALVRGWPTGRAAMVDEGGASTAQRGAHAPSCFLSPAPRAAPPARASVARCCGRGTVCRFRGSPAWLLRLLFVALPAAAAAPARGGHHFRRPTPLAAAPRIVPVDAQAWAMAQP